MRGPRYFLNAPDDWGKLPTAHHKHSHGRVGAPGTPPGSGPPRHHSVDDHAKPDRLGPRLSRCRAAPGSLGAARSVKTRESESDSFCLLCVVVADVHMHAYHRSEVDQRVD